MIIRNQLLRASFSIPANIAEGFGGNKGNTFKNYLVIARRSLTETDYWLFLLHDLKFLESKIYDKLVDMIKAINAMLSSLINKLEKI